MILSVILVSYNTAEMSIEALKCLFASQTDVELEVFVVDNASKDDSVNAIKNAYPKVNLIENKINVGFGRANNQVLQFVTGDYVLLLNTDAFVQSDSISKTINYMQAHANTGVLGVRLIGRDAEQQPSCRFFPTPFNSFVQRLGLESYFPNTRLVDDPNWNPQLTQKCDWVPGCYYLVRKSVIDQVGLFDPKYFLYSEEVDHCLAVKKAGWDVDYFSGTTVVHIGGESAKSDGDISANGKQLSLLQTESELIYFRKNFGLLACWAHMLLTIVGDFVQFIKDCSKFKLFKSNYFFDATKLILITAFKTSFGSKPVR